MKEEKSSSWSPGYIFDQPHKPGIFLIEKRTPAFVVELRYMQMNATFPDKLSKSKQIMGSLANVTSWFCT